MIGIDTALLLMLIAFLVGLVAHEWLAAFQQLGRPLDPELAVEQEYSRARQAMNEAAGQIWRNLAR